MDGGGVGWIDMETMLVGDTVPLPEGGLYRGIAVDFDGYVWAVMLGAGTAHKIDPNTYNVETFSGLNNPYTYSDMAGGSSTASTATRRPAETDRLRARGLRRSNADEAGSLAGSGLGRWAVLSGCRADAIPGLDCMSRTVSCAKSAVRRMRTCSSGGGGRARSLVQLGDTRRDQAGPQSGLLEGGGRAHPGLTS